MKEAPRYCCPAPTQLPDLAREHCAFLREFGKVQDRVTGILQQKETELQILSHEVVRLRGQLLVARTALLWGAGTAASIDDAAPRPARRPPAAHWAGRITRPAAAPARTPPDPAAASAPP